MCPADKTLFPGALPESLEDRAASSLVSSNAHIRFPPEITLPRSCRPSRYYDLYAAILLDALVLSYLPYLRKLDRHAHQWWQDLRVRIHRGSIVVLWESDLRRVELFRFGWRGAYTSAATNASPPLPRPPSHLCVFLLPIRFALRRAASSSKQTDALDIHVPDALGINEAVVLGETRRLSAVFLLAGATSSLVNDGWVAGRRVHAAYTPAGPPLASPTHTSTTLWVSSRSSKPSPRLLSPVHRQFASSDSVAVHIADTAHDFAVSPFTLVAPTMQEHHKLLLGVLEDGAFPPPFWHVSWWAEGVTGDSSVDADVLCACLGSVRVGSASRGLAVGANGGCRTLGSTRLPALSPSAASFHVPDHLPFPTPLAVPAQVLLRLAVVGCTLGGWMWMDSGTILHDLFYELSEQKQKKTRCLSAWLDGSLDGRRSTRRPRRCPSVVAARYGHLRCTYHICTSIPL
ncbi:hypothetical protein C8F01DRAFT_1373425 [Mycena amicta]|nr:hypothetical protein C8F01DRAFT_1373425 [Mycena amicta]